jgi:hypothetical protein
MAMNLDPFKPDPHHAAYIGLVVALVAFGFAIAALGAALVLGVR